MSSDFWTGVLIGAIGAWTVTALLITAGLLWITRYAVDDPTDQPREPETRRQPATLRTAAQPTFADALDARKEWFRPTPELMRHIARLQADMAEERG